MKGVYLWRRAGEHDLAALHIYGGICIFVYLYLYLCLYSYLYLYLWRGAGEHNLDGYQWKYGSTESGDKTERWVFENLQASMDGTIVHRELWVLKNCYCIFWTIYVSAW